MPWFQTLLQSYSHQNSTVQFSCSVVSCSGDPTDCSTPGFLVHQQIPGLAQTHVNRVGDAIQPSHPLSFPSPPAFKLSQHQGLFQWVSSSHQVAKVLELQLQHHSFQWIFRADFLQDWVVWSCSSRDSQESSPTPQFKSINSSVLAFFIVQLSHPYMTTGKTKTLTKWTFVGKVMSLFFNMLSRFVIAFLPRSKCLFISWLQSPSAVILELKKINSVHCFHCFPINLPWHGRTRCHDIHFLNVEF